MRHGYKETKVGLNPQDIVTEKNEKISGENDFGKNSKSIYYFDTNVISYLSDQTPITDINLQSKASVAPILIDSLEDRNKFTFPYSFAHLRATPCKSSWRGASFTSAPWWPHRLCLYPTTWPGN